MAIRTVVTRGFGNGTFNGTIGLAALRGYIAAAFIAIPIALNLQNWNVDYATVLQQLSDRPEIVQFTFDLIETINELRDAIDALEARIVALE